jgi:hypothetical protein
MVLVSIAGMAAVAKPLFGSPTMANNAMPLDLFQ